MGEQQSDLETVRMTYAGRRVSGMGKVAGWWAAPWAGEALSSWPKLKVGGLVVGGVYEGQGSPERASLVLSSLRFVGMDEEADPDHVVRWRAADRAAQVEVDAKAAERKARDENTLDRGMTLQQAREWIAGGVGRNRVARLAVVLRELGV